MSYVWNNLPLSYHISAVISTFGLHSFMRLDDVYVIKQKWKQYKYQNMHMAHLVPNDVALHLANCSWTDVDLYYSLIDSGFDVISSMLVSAS